MIKKSFLVPLVALIVIGAGSFVTVAYANHTWGNYHWARTANPLALKLGDDLSPSWHSYLVTASADWSLSSVLDTSVVRGSTNPKTCKPVSGRVEVCNSKYGNTGWLGVASVSTNGDHITAATVKLNDTYFNTPSYNTAAWKTFVVCQEVGHAFGLDHQDVDFNNLNLGTCMDYTNNPGRNDGVGTNLHPNQHDYDELQTIYTHLDTVTTSRQVLASKPQEVDHTDRSTWGKQIRASSNGHSAVYERDFDKGEKVFTFVVWTNE